MKNIILFSVLILGCFLTNCKNTTQSSVESEIVEVPYDSTYYWQLTEAYNNDDTILLKQFYRNWYELSQSKPLKTDSLTIMLEGVFNAIYHPFQIEKYNWLSRPWFLNYEYAILPTKVYYKIGNYLENYDTIYSIQMDSIIEFYPKPKFKNAKILYDVEPFTTAMKSFLVKGERKNSNKLFFLGEDYFIITPMSYFRDEYLTSPEIKGILINPEKNKAIAVLRLISSGLKVTVEKKSGEWKMTKVEDLWIE